MVVLVSVRVVLVSRDCRQTAAPVARLAFEIHANPGASQGQQAFPVEFWGRSARLQGKKE